MPGAFADYDLEACSVCGRIMRQRHLRGGRCRDKTDCAAAQTHRWRAQREAVDAIKEDESDDD